MNKLENIKLGGKLIVKAKMLNTAIMRIVVSDIYVEGTISQIGDDYCLVDFIDTKDGKLVTHRYSVQEIFSF